MLSSRQWISTSNLHLQNGPPFVDENVFNMRNWKTFFDTGHVEIQVYAKLDILLK